MKKAIQLFCDEAVKHVAKLAVVGLLGVVALYWSHLRAWGSHHTPAEFALWLRVVGLTLLGVFLILFFGRMHLRTRRQLRELMQAQAKSQQHPQQIYVANEARTVGRPSPAAFQVLKWFSTLGLQSTAGVDTVTCVFGFSYGKALALVKELHEGNFIYTAIHSPGDWNGEYAITRGGRECVEKYGT